MAEVHQAPGGGKGGGLPAAVQRLRELFEAAQRLEEAWVEGLNRRSYPRYIPSFDAFVWDVANWLADAQELADVEAGTDEKAAVDLTDPEAAREWLAFMASKVDDLAGAGEDATRAPGRRLLGRAMARSHVLEGRHSLRVMIASARRGLPPKPEG